MSSVTIVSNEDYNISGDLKEGLLFLHCEVLKFNKTVLKSIRDSFEVVLDEAMSVGHVAVYAATENERFVEALGVPYKLLNEHEGMKVLVWPKEH